MLNGFTLQDTNTAPAASAELKGVRRTWGFVPNLHRVLAESPAALEASKTLWTIAGAKLEALRQSAAKVTRQRRAVSEADVTAFQDAGYDNRAALDVLVLAATKLISHYANHLAQTPNVAFMKGAEWTAPGKLKAAP